MIFDIAILVLLYCMRKRIYQFFESAERRDARLQEEADAKFVAEALAPYAGLDYDKHECRRDKIRSVK